jgi:hypothetical protein
VEFVVGPSRPKASDLRNIAIGLHQQAKRAKRAVTMSDGTGHEIDTYLYDDPMMCEVSEAITGASFEQAIRGRGVKRTADNPLLLVLMANHVAPIAVEASPPLSVPRSARHRPTGSKTHQFALRSRRPWPTARYDSA